MAKDDLVLGHGSSRSLSRDEQEAVSQLHFRKAKQAKEEADRKEQLEGYRFWCSEGCGFVDSDNHRCEQWTHITYVSPALFEAIKKL